MVHWLNNKELHFTLEAEKILSELNKGGVATTDESLTDDRDTQGNVTEDGEDLVNGDDTELEPHLVSKGEHRSN